MLYFIEIISNVVYAGYVEHGEKQLPFQYLNEKGN